MNNLVNKYKLTQLKLNINQTFDLFICSSSFDERCLSVAKNININNIKHTALMYNNEYLEYISNNKSFLEGMFFNTVTMIELKHSDPIFSVDNINEALLNIEKTNKISSVLLDITTFTHETLLMLLRFFQIVLPDANITCIYANASEYDSDNERNNKWLSKGVKEIRSVLGYSGHIIPTQKTRLIVIVGYEYERAASIINIMEPNALALGYGQTEDATTDKDKDANEHYLQLVKKMLISFTQIKQFTIKCNDPFETEKALSSYINNIKNENIIIIPLNNKISTIGVAITAMKNNNIQLCYAPALTYNFSNYSTPGDYCYTFNISEILNNTREKTE